MIQLEIQAKFNAAVRAYIACENADDKEVMAYFLRIELAKLQESADNLDFISKGDRAKLAAMFKEHQMRMITEMLRYIAQGNK